MWGPRIPAWYCLRCNPDILINFIDNNGNNISARYKKIKEQYGYDEIKQGLQTLTAPKDASYTIEKDACPDCKSSELLQETDTFDTWFSSGQWPLTALRYPDSEDFKYFYPTSVLDTLWDILFFWVARMIMFGLYLTDEVPFKVAHMHSRVVDEKGQKMSKSKGNVINPLEIAEQYGTDALRMSLVFGSSPGGDITLGDDKFKAMRNFCNKVWNASRFIFLMAEKQNWDIKWKNKKNKEDKEMVQRTSRLRAEVDDQLDNYRFGLALEEIYECFWHQFCDQYIEDCKDRVEQSLPTLIAVLTDYLKLLHPFAPFMTETIYQIFKEKLKSSELFKEKHIAVSSWPE